MKKYLLSTLMLLSSSFVVADGHSSVEKKVLSALETYFEARNNRDWETVVAYESNSELTELIQMGVFTNHLLFSQLKIGPIQTKAAL